MTLADLTPGEWRTVAAILASGSQRQRLLDLGLVPGTRVKLVFTSPSGNPAAYLIRGAVIALRLDAARLIEVN